VLQPVTGGLATRTSDTAGVNRCNLITKPGQAIDAAFTPSGRYHSTRSKKKHDTCHTQKDKLLCAHVVSVHGTKWLHGLRALP
jgi:hypothetical protein